VSSEQEGKRVFVLAAYCSLKAAYCLLPKGLAVLDLSAALIGSAAG